MNARTIEATILQLNAAAENYNDNGHEPLESMELAARDADLVLVEDDGEQCRIYGMPTAPDINDVPQYAYLVNCWIEGKFGQELGDGGAGFDDQIEWYTERQ